RIGRRVPRGAGGYTVHRPEHWVFDGCEFEWGDLLGARSTVVGYECDGCASAGGSRAAPAGTRCTAPSTGCSTAVNSNGATCSERGRLSSATSATAAR